MTCQQVAISGASGLIGSALQQSLVTDGHDVRAIVRDPQSGAGQPNQIRWSPLVGLSNPFQLDSLDCVVHLAGRSIAAARWSSKEKQRIRDSRVRATKLLTDQICNLPAPPRVFLCASAIGIYGDRGTLEIDESTPPSIDFLAEIASAWEEACTALNSVGVRVVHLRFGIVLSKSGGALAKVLPLFRMLLGGKLGSGNQYWSWIALQDCVAAIRWLMDQDSAVGAYNLVAPNAITNAEFTQKLASALHVPAVVPTPAWALRLALGEMADSLLLSSCRVLPRRLLASGFNFEFPELGSFLSAELSS